MGALRAGTGSGCGRHRRMVNPLVPKGKLAVASLSERQPNPVLTSWGNEKTRWLFTNQRVFNILAEAVGFEPTMQF